MSPSLQGSDMMYRSKSIYREEDTFPPNIIEMFKEDTLDKLGADLRDSVIFHTAVSPAGVDSMFSNKQEIASIIAPFSEGGVVLP